MSDRNIGILYLNRIGIKELPANHINAEFLSHIHSQHCISIPFENLDMHIGNYMPNYDIDKVYNKIVERKRGGFCLEQACLCYKALQDLGFKVTLHAGEVNSPGGWLFPDIHTLLLVQDLPDSPYLFDVGFPDTSVNLISLNEENVLNCNPPKIFHSSAKYKRFYYKKDMMEDGFEYIVRYILEPDGSGNFFPILRFRPDRCLTWEEKRLGPALDWLCYHNTSPFVKSIIVSLQAADGSRVTISGMRFIVTNTEGEKTISTIENKEQLISILKAYFNIDLPDISDKTVDGEEVKSFGPEFLC